MNKTFQEFAAEDLAAFGWTIGADEIPDSATCKRVTRGIFDWYNALDDRTRRIIDDSDISAGLINQGFFTEWPALATCFKASTVGWFASTIDSVVAALGRADHAVAEQTNGSDTDVLETVGGVYNPDSI